jgi:hypothetical protein
VKKTTPSRTDSEQFGQITMRSEGMSCLQLALMLLYWIRPHGRSGKLPRLFPLCRRRQRLALEAANLRRYGVPD